MVALDIFCPGSSILLDGMVADSIPKNAKKVKVVVAVIACQLLVPLILNGSKFCRSKNKIPPIATNTSGTILRIVVMRITLPEAYTPKVFTQVSNQRQANPVANAILEFCASIGKKVLNALTKDTTMAALVVQTEIK